MTIDDKALDEYEALAAAATPGPWRSVASLSMDGEVVSMLEHRDAPAMSADIDGVSAHEDARFIAASRTMGPALCAALRAERAEVRRLRAEHTRDQLLIGLHRGVAKRLREAIDEAFEHQREGLVKQAFEVLTGAVESGEGGSK